MTAIPSKRDAIVQELMHLEALNDFHEIEISDVSRQAGVSLS